MHPTLCNLHCAPYTVHPTPCTLHRAPCTLDHAPCTLHPQHSTLHPQPSTLNPQPSTPNPQPSTLNPQPSTLNPQPPTLNPQPSTLNPQPPTSKIADAELGVVFEQLQWLIRISGHLVADEGEVTPRCPSALTTMRVVLSATRNRKHRWFRHSGQFTQTGHIPVRSRGGAATLAGGRPG